MHVNLRADVAAANPPNTAWRRVQRHDQVVDVDVCSLFAGAKGFHSSAFDVATCTSCPRTTEPPTAWSRAHDTRGGSAPPGRGDIRRRDVTGTAKGFIGAAFDGRYLYLVPYNNGAYNGVAAALRHDAMFGDASSWSTFDIATVDPNARGLSCTPRSMAATSTSRALQRRLSRRHGTLRYAGRFRGRELVDDLRHVDRQRRAKGFLGAQFDGLLRLLRASSTTSLTTAS